VSLWCQTAILTLVRSRRPCQRQSLNLILFGSARVRHSMRSKLVLVLYSVQYRCNLVFKFTFRRDRAHIYLDKMQIFEFMFSASMVRCCY
jgi:hypothetical protein